MPYGCHKHTASHMWLGHYQVSKIPLNILGTNELTCGLRVTCLIDPYLPGSDEKLYFELFFFNVILNLLDLASYLLSATLHVCRCLILREILGTLDSFTARIPQLRSHMRGWLQGGGGWTLAFPLCYHLRGWLTGRKGGLGRWGLNRTWQIGYQPALGSVW